MRVELDLSALKALLDNAAQIHGDVEIDLEIIESIVAGWSDGGHKPSLQTLADKLIDIGRSLINTHDLKYKK